MREIWLRAHAPRPGYVVPVWLNGAELMLLLVLAKFIFAISVLLAVFKSAAIAVFSPSKRLFAIFPYYAPSAKVVQVSKEKK